MTDILCLGEAMVELNAQPDGRYLRGFGGDTSNTAVAAARQGAEVGYITRLGRDGFGDALTAMWREEGVASDLVIRDPAAPTGLYFVDHGPDGHVFSYRRAGSAASLMRPEDLPVDAIRSARILHVSGISQGISASAADTVFAAIEVARAAGVRVSYDTNLRPALWPLARARAVIHAAVSSCQIALPGLDDARALTGRAEPDAILDFYLELGVEVVALTLGAEGTRVATPEVRRHLPPHTVTALDATGAGDTFDGAFLAELAAGRDPFDAARYANVAAALSTQGYGAVGPMPRRVEVEAAMG
ncbi:MAG: sugar kinase [Pseudomonadota bacterium]